jgi:hypothetical protein
MIGTTGRRFGLAMLLPIIAKFFFGSKESIEIRNTYESNIPVARSLWGAAGMDAYSIMKARHNSRRGKMVRRYSGTKSKVHA